MLDQYVLVPTVMDDEPCIGAFCARCSMTLVFGGMDRPVPVSELVRMLEAHEASDHG